MKTADMKVADLIPYEFNNKVHDSEQVNRIANSIREFWFTQPLVVDQNNVVIIGHGRLLAAIKLGLETVPVLKIENLTETQIKKLRILDNKLNESERDNENLKLELKDLDYDLSVWDLELKAEDLFELELEEIDDGNEIIEDEIPEVEEAKVVKESDFFFLWNHRLLCWDSTKEENVKTLIDWWQIDMVFTDPPYNIDYSWVTDKRKVRNDNMEQSDFLKFLKDSLPVVDTAYVCCSWQNAEIFKKAMTEKGMPPKAMIVRNKVNPAQNLDKYFKQHEIIFYYWKFWGEETLRGDIRECKREVNTVHPTMKPINLVATALKDNPDKETVYDWFWWSGSTLIASEYTNKKCYMMELDPKYCEVIIKRFHQLNPTAEIKCVNRDIDLTVLFDE